MSSEEEPHQHTVNKCVLFVTTPRSNRQIVKARKTKGGIQLRGVDQNGQSAEKDFHYVFTCVKNDTKLVTFQFEYKGKFYHPKVDEKAVKCVLEKSTFKEEDPDEISFECKTIPCWFKMVDIDKSDQHHLRTVSDDSIGLLERNSVFQFVIKEETQEN